MLAVWIFGFAALVTAKLTAYGCIVLDSRFMEAVIVTSFLLIVLTLGNVGDFTMADNTVFPVVLTTVSLICGCLSLQGIERRDVM